MEAGVQVMKIYIICFEHYCIEVSGSRLDVDQEGNTVEIWDDKRLKASFNHDKVMGWGSKEPGV